jgi:hypothetical protein
MHSSWTQQSTRTNGAEALAENWLPALWSKQASAEYPGFTLTLSHTYESSTVGVGFVHLKRECAMSRARPNPSIERTSTGLAHSTPQVYSPFRGPSRFRPAHVKR